MVGQEGSATTPSSYLQDGRPGHRTPHIPQQLPPVGGSNSGLMRAQPSSLADVAPPGGGNALAEPQLLLPGCQAARVHEAHATCAGAGRNQASAILAVRSLPAGAAVRLNSRPCS